MDEENDFLPPPNKSIPFEVLKPAQLKALPSKVQELYQHIFNKKRNNVEFEKYIPFKPDVQKMPFCNQPLFIDDIYYECYDCGSNSMICKLCFFNGNHRGHRFERYRLVSDEVGHSCSCGRKGTCEEHSGRLKQMKVSSSKRKQFMAYFLSLFDWYFRMQGTSHQEQFGRIFFSYLSELITDNPYNIRLTSYLFSQPIGGKSILHRCLRLENQESFEVMILKIIFERLDLFDDFNELMLIELGKVLRQREYNNIYFTSLVEIFFKKSEQLICKLIKEKRLVVFRVKKLNQLMRYPKTFSTLIQFDSKTILAYIKEYLKEESLFEFYRIPDIQKEVENGQKTIIQTFSSRFFNGEKNFIRNVVKVIEVFRKERKELIKMTKAFMKELQGLTFAKNKIVLVYHRLLSMLIFTLFEGSLEEMTFFQLQTILMMKADELFSFMKVNTKVVLGCLLEYSQTFVNNSYFTNYEGYMKSNYHQYDYLFVRIACCLFTSIGYNIEELIEELYVEDYNKSHLMSNQPNTEEWINKWIVFISILSEIVVSNRTDITLANKLKIENSTLKRQQNHTIQSFVTLITPFHQKHIPDIKLFFSNNTIKEQHISHYLQYETSTNIFYINKNRLQYQYQPFSYKYYVSAKKQQIFLNHKRLQQSSPILYHKNTSIAKALAIPNIIQRLASQMRIQYNAHGSGTQYKTLIQLFMVEIQKIMVFKSEQNRKLPEVYSRLEKLIIEDKKKNKKTEMNKELIKRAKLQKIKSNTTKILEEYNEMESSRSKFKQSQHKEESEEEVCLICREQIQDEPLLCLAYVNATNLFNSKVNEPKQGVYFGGCMHLIHLQCFRENCMESKKCPLCKILCNIVLPGKSSHISHRRIPQFILNTMMQNISHKIKNPQYIFELILNSFHQLIGMSAIYNHTYYNKHLHKLGSSVFVLLEYLWNQLNAKQRQRLQLLAFPKNPSLMHFVRLFISHFLIKQLKKQPFRTPEFSQHIHKDDLFVLQESLRLLVKKQIKYTIWEKRQKSEQGKKTIKQSFKIYSPPETMKAVLELESNLNTPPKCKHFGHFVFCIICSEVLCKECKDDEKHNQLQHCGQMLYFDLRNGGVFFNKSKFYVDLRSMYKNKFREEWEPSSDPSSYLFDRSRYDELVNKFMSRRMNEYYQN